MGRGGRGAPGGSPWPAYADLLAGMLGCLLLVVLAAVVEQAALAERYRQASEDYRRAHEELEAMRLEKRALEERLARDLQGLIAAGLVDLDDGVVAIRGSLLFDSASAELSSEGLALLRRAAPAIAAWSEGGAIMVSGHTDDLPIANREFRSNWELSTARATEVVTALIDRGVPAERLVAAGFGEHRPVADNGDPAGRARNRRVEIARVAGP